MLDDSRDARKQPRDAEPDHHAHHDADVRKDVVCEGKLLFHVEHVTSIRRGNLEWKAPLSHRSRVAHAGGSDCWNAVLSSAPPLACARARAGRDSTRSR